MMENKMENTRVYRGYIGIMEKKTETTIHVLHTHSMGIQINS